MPASADAQKEKPELAVKSPDGKVRVEFSLRTVDDRKSVACYSVSFKDRELIRPSSLQLQLAPGGLLGPLRIVEVAHSKQDEVYALKPGKTSSVRDRYHELKVTLEEEDHAPNRRLDILFRAYDEGVAFRYSVGQQTGFTEFNLAAEHSTFAVAGNPQMYVLPLPSFTTPYEARYRTLHLNEISTDSLLAVPLLIEYEGGAWAAILEADLKDYAGMYLSGSPDGVLTSRLSVRPDDPQLKVKASLPHASPWRVVMIGDDPGRLIESNLITSLNPPCTWQDTAWIKPGKTTFPWWNGYALGDAGFTGAQDTRTHKYYIDFCAKSGIPYHSLDGFNNIAWYGGFIVPYQGADITKSLPEIDLPELLAYAKQKGVRLRLWMNSAAARAQMHHAFPIYEQWGIEGVMVDFVERDDQDAVNFIHELLQLSAEHHLTVTLHNISKPTGLHRTYPNLLTIESVFNTEYNKWDARGSTPDHELTVPFVRMLAGPLDYHCGSFHNVPPQKFAPRNVAPVTMGTRSHELARYVVYENYLPMMVDYPAAYRNQPGFEFLVKVPTFWDETKVLNGKLGAYLTIARRHGADWYIGSMAGNDAQTLTLAFDFLAPRTSYQADIWSDDLTTLDDATKIVQRKQDISATDHLEIKLAPAGGHVIRLSPKS